MDFFYSLQVSTVSMFLLCGALAGVIAYCLLFWQVESRNYNARGVKVSLISFLIVAAGALVISQRVVVSENVLLGMTDGEGVTVYVRANNIRATKIDQTWERFSPKPKTGSTWENIGRVDCSGMTVGECVEMVKTHESEIFAGDFSSFNVASK